MRRFLLCASLISLACDSDDADEAARAAENALDKAKRGYDKAEKGVRKGYDKAEKGVRKGYDKAEKGVRKGYDKAEKGVRKGYDKAEKGVRTGADKAGKALRKAEDGARAGYDEAKARIDGIDWVQAFESTRDTIDQAGNALEAPSDPGPANAWWNRGAEAVECKANTCTVAPWFVSEARSNPTRMMGDVKIFTAPDDSGWLLGNVREGSAAHAMGFRAGDVVRTIGGHPLTDKLARLEILAKLRKADEVQTTFVRKGETKVSTLTIRFETAAG
jgi:hypothetical protein